ncbi:hypothetical protein [Magnetospirillum molischianum]|uniref:Uncharacterized protein n=1 Tax=Magnetospirillum molischianum DSM 120 TaxID=1150626 RepID=H8FTB1_MAGML|nr:hypothetical protein [Magnetospirillum molischianum]CCG41599.1 exported hypothetical protein [Magnetospirillum molischianum DSM 120]
MFIDRRTLFLEAWKQARRIRSRYRNLRTAFAAALRTTWELVRAFAAEEARRPTPKPAPVVRKWEDENPYRARAVAARKARLGSYVVNCW